MTRENELRYGNGMGKGDVVLCNIASYNFSCTDVVDHKQSGKGAEDGIFAVFVRINRMS